MNTYNITVKFKNGNTINISLEGEDKLRNRLAKEWQSSRGLIYIADYVLSTSEILWIKVEGADGEYSGEELSDIREKK